MFIIYFSYLELESLLINFHLWKEFLHKVVDVISILVGEITPWSVDNILKEYQMMAYHNFLPQSWRIISEIFTQF